MADENYKLAKFQAAVFAEVDLKAAQMKQEAEQYKEQELEKNKAKQLDRSYQIIQKKTQEIKKSCKRQVAKYSLDAKRSLLLKREEITKKIFESVAIRLAEFHKTEQYKDYLLKRIKKVSENNYDMVEILLLKEDMKFAEEIQKTYEHSCTVVETNRIQLGGFILRDDRDGIYIDETLEQKLQDQKAYYIQNSGLVI